MPHISALTLYIVCDISGPEFEGLKLTVNDAQNEYQKGGYDES